MNKLSKEKKNQLLLVGVAAIGVIAALWFCLIQNQKARLREIATKNANTQQEIKKIQRVAQEAGSVNESLSNSVERLQKIENGMPSGDLFSWMVGAVKQFNVPSYKVDMPQFGAPSLSDVRLFPAFPYRQATFAISGSAYYYDLGKFLADFENHFPYLRVQNVNLEPGLGNTAEDREKLYFRMEIVSLIKTNSI